ncbi:MAG: PKD domain-containing protein [bacterium]
MIKRFVFLIILIAAAGCVKDMGINPGFNEPDLWELERLESVQNQDGTYHYKLKFPAWESGVDGYGRGPKIKILGELELRSLLPTLDGFYVFEGDFANKDIFIEGIGRYRLNADKKLEWAWSQVWNRVQDNSEYDIAGEQMIGITFRDGKISPIDIKKLSILEAVIWVSSDKVNTGGNIYVDGSMSSGSINPMSTIIDWEWNFGDGAIKHGVKANHAYMIAGKKIITLTVTDNLDKRQSTSVTIEVITKVYPEGADFGDDYVRFAFNHTAKTIRIYANFDMVKSKREKEYIYGNFHGPESAWVLYDKSNGLQFDDHHQGWGYIEIELRPVMDLSFGFSGWYEGSKQSPDFSNTNFDHMKYCIYYVGPDIHVIIYSSGQISKYKG